MTDRTLVRTIGGFCLILAMVPHGAAAGQATPAPSGGAPPIVRFSPDGVTLEEAVKLALTNDAELARAEADLARRRGVLQEQRGPFDLTLLGNVSFSRRIQEMTESRKNEERKKRTDLDKAITNQDAGVRRLETTQSVVNRLRTNPTDAQAIADLTPLSPSLSSTLQTLNQLIATASTPTLRTQYESIRSDTLTNAANTGNSLVTQSRADLAAIRQQRIDIGEAPVDEVFNDYTFQLQVSKLFRSGVSVSPFFDSSFTSTGFVGKPHQKELGGKGLTDFYTFHAGAQAFVPLGRGRGSRATGALERAAALDVQAGEQALEYQASVTAFNAIQAYWQLRAAQERLEIADQSLQFQLQLVKLTQGRAGDLPGSELARARAAQARSQAQQQDAQRSFKDARVGLADALGISATDEDVTLPTRARDPFPVAPTTVAAAPMAAFQQSAAQRQDLAAAGRAVEASTELVEGARLNLKSVLDLNLGSWFTALDEGTGQKALDRWVGPSVNASLNYEKPLGNNRLQGQLAQREAELRLSQIEQQDLARRIRLSVAQSASTLQETVTRVQQTETAVTLFQTTINAQMQRLQDGVASVIDTIITQQEQIEMLLGRVSARSELAAKIAELRFRTGRLVDGRNVQGANLVTIPTGVTP